jgi:5-methylcytosine-specific restriction endonuclease McrA
MSKAWSNGSTKGWREIRKRIMIRDQATCQLCGQVDGQMHIDHIIPKRLNGSDMDSNLRVLCKSCNLRRGGAFFEHDRTPPTLHDGFTPTNVSISHD